MQQGQLLAVPCCFYILEKLELKINSQYYPRIWFA